MLQQRLEEEFVRAKRYNHQLTLLMIDVDDFKRFNDSYGHIAGDHALAEIGRVLTEHVRDVDLISRYGGEEFAIVLPETDAAGAFIAAEKVREAVATHVFAIQGGETRLTISIGLANSPVHALDRESLLRAADGALYEAKHTGRNRVRVAHPFDEVADAVDAVFHEEIVDTLEGDSVS
jgi:diguanylate cyclase (GGDEF)-like protein